MTNDKKQQFIGKWSTWFITHKKAKELTEAFKRELDELIFGEFKKSGTDHTSGRTNDWIIRNLAPKPWDDSIIFHMLEEARADEREKMKDEARTEKALNGITPDWIANKVQPTGITERPCAECGGEIANNVFPICAKCWNEAVFKREQSRREPQATSGMTEAESNFDKDPDFRTMIAQEMSRTELIDRLCEYDETIKKLKAQLDQEEQPKQGMTEADFEKAKAGAEIEKNDGRQARVICWDLKVKNDTSIIVAIEVAGMEAMRRYTKFLFMSDFRLRTTKREGWVKISKETPCYNTREECEKRESQDGIIAHITWEENQ